MLNYLLIGIAVVALAALAVWGTGGVAFFVILPLTRFVPLVASILATVAVVMLADKAGEDIGLHTHDGVEISWVIRGNIRLVIAGGESKIYHAGESFLIPRGTVHDPINVGPGEAEVAVNYVLDKGSPMRNPLDIPLPPECKTTGPCSVKAPAK